ncbi:protein-ADP-ribose hydrolase [Actinoplanes awajinensis]|uniref:Protein-ADP-ribose hydrolase n=1 Tax=Actinoplanes awajinensis subsp. mycoplanecinus TaxID=135947 RepID=A0A124G8E9_9ACTN|nr:protein-ADP-ribose hydrolase [Actinoplanes awajinensis]KUL25676.1 Appr-1-p processing protein [Actinoplanes awajinensis subsp. mycoplanecinus]
MLGLDDYRQLIDLDRPFRPAAEPAAPGRSGELIARLRARDREHLRSLLTVRAPGPLPHTEAAVLDALLGGERARRPAVDAAALPTVDGTRVIWLGDITTLRVDAVVNAANSALLGCFRPSHRCVDNVIHAAAGPRLRADCHTIMSAQGGPEPTGAAKVTRGYHLPARYVLHTVGPIVDGVLGGAHREALASSYRQCLDLAEAVGDIRSVAFCAVSTGLFGFPKAAAARIALTTTADWLAEHPGVLDRVVFDVFSPDDLAVYQEEL